MGPRCRTMTEWVVGRMDVSPETAATLVRASRVLADLPLLSLRLGRGELSFDRTCELAKRSLRSRFMVHG